MEYIHKPVLLAEVLKYLDPKPGQNFIDGTLGGGGYSLELLKKVGAKGRVLSLDLDEAAINNFQNIVPKKFKGNSIVAHGNFSQMGKIALHHKFPAPNGIVLDLGLSSFQLEQSKRGFSFQKSEPLDMRFDEAGNKMDARFLLNNYDAGQLAKIFREFGEERFASIIAKAIVRQRKEKAFHLTTDLVECIKTALPKPVKHKYQDSSRRIFQALRIAVNGELENLQIALEEATNILTRGGRLVVVSFHSLEDRIVKQHFVKAAKGCVCPPEFPICQCGRNPILKILTKKPVLPSEAEITLNSRSKSAKLRAATKL